MDHCRFGIGGGEVDWITPLENWVEKGQAPEEVTAYHMVKEPYPSIERPVNEVAERLMLMARHPLPAGSYDRAHPVYPYPDWPRYSGKGDPNLPSSWEKAPRQGS
jgi:feruloyl esterase